MAYLPKDYSQHQNKIFLGLTFKKIVILVFFMFLSLLILKLSFLSWFIRALLMIPVVLAAPIFVLYTTADGDDIITYLIKLLIYYASPKYLVYRKSYREKTLNKNREEK